MELKEGMFIRRFGINKIKTIHHYNEDEYLINGFYVYKHEIKKASYNIIDLVEIGDFVNHDQINGGIILNKTDDGIDTWSILPSKLKNEDIKSVITREQLLSMKYNLESEVN